MKITVITINLNNRLGLEETVKSIVNQSFQDFEYIIIDGGSTDGSINIIEEYKHKLHYWISEPDKGIYDAMNKGIHIANGEYLLFLNSGDKLSQKDILLNASQYLTNTEIVYGDLRLILKDDKVDQLFPDRLTFGYLFEHYLPHPASFIKRDLFKKIGLYDEKYVICADWTFFMQAICGFNVTYQHIPLIISEFNVDGISADEKNQQIIREERNQFVISEFPFLHEEYSELMWRRERMKAIQRSKVYRFLRYLNINKKVFKF